MYIKNVSLSILYTDINVDINTHTHTHTHIYVYYQCFSIYTNVHNIYIYIYSHPLGGSVLDFN